MEDFWSAFCGESNCSDTSQEPCSASFKFLTYPTSCVNHALIICFDLILIALLMFNMIQKTSPKISPLPGRYKRFSWLQVASAAFNGCLGLVYFCLGIWVLEGKLKNSESLLPLHWWTIVFLQGFTWFSVGLTVSLRGRNLPKAPLRLLSIFAFLTAGLVCLLSLFAVVVNKQPSFKGVLDVLSFIGAILLLRCTYKGSKREESDEIFDNESSLYAPLNGDDTIGIAKADSPDQVTSSFVKAGLCSRLSFWWMNSLMKKGREKPLEENDIPKLRGIDGAEACFTQFKEQLNKQKRTDPSSRPSILRTIILCHWKEILISGFFALLKVLTVSAGPLLLNAFIKVAEGNESFKYEGYILAISLFISKSLESLSQRQWYFRTRLIGLKVRSLLTAAIYRKQLRLSNAARMTHSGGEIMNYVTVDAYRIGEFPFWFHQTWTTSVQLCLALFILFHAVGLQQSLPWWL